MILRIAVTTLFVTVLVDIALDPECRAGVWLQTSVNATMTAGSQAGSDSSDIRMLTSSTAGYSFIQGFMVGAQFLTTKPSQTGGSTYSVGPKAGVLLRGFELSAAYLPIARDRDGSSLRSGGGFAINLGYSFRALGPVRIGLQGLYWLTTFNDVDGGAPAVKPRVSELAPLFSLGLDI